MTTTDNLQLWPDDTAAAAQTLALAAAGRGPAHLGDLIHVIGEHLAGERGTEYVLRIIGLLTNEMCDDFCTDATAEQYRTARAQAEAHELDMRQRGEWRDEHNKQNGDK